MGDSDGQGVGGVDFGQLGKAEEGANHLADLHLIRLSSSSHGTLDTCGGVFKYGKVSACQAEKCDAAGVSQLACGLGIFGEEERFHCAFVWFEASDNREKLFINLDKTLGEGAIHGGIDDAVGNVNQPSPLGTNYPPAEVACSWIDTDNDHGKSLSHLTPQDNT